MSHAVANTSIVGSLEQPMKGHSFPPAQSFIEETPTSSCETPIASPFCDVLNAAISEIVSSPWIHQRPCGGGASRVGRFKTENEAYRVTRVRAKTKAAQDLKLGCDLNVAALTLFDGSDFSTSRNV